LEELAGWARSLEPPPVGESIEAAVDLGWIYL
jgi:hypothetical protein